jgi:hypothetical protein
LGSAWLGTPDAWDEIYQLRPTTDGGALVCGFIARRPFGITPREGVVIKLDSLFAEQWRYTYYKPTGDYEWGAIFQDGWETANGHYVVWGGREDSAMVLRELVPPTVTGQAPTVAWRYTPPYLQRAGPTIFLYETGNPMYGFGYFSPPSGSGGFIDNDFYQCRLMGLPAPAVLDYCRVAPRLDSVRLAPIGGRLDSLAFWLEPFETHAGPRYAELSLVEWDFGDGSPPAEGWQVTHRYQSPTPVRMRVCATNNLGCRVCRERLPYGPLGVQQERAAALAVYPNPAPDGRFRLSGTAGATVAVLDALGRAVQRPTMAAEAPEQALDLSAQPPGVYFLRLTWPDGGQLTRRLVR